MRSVDIDLAFKAHVGTDMLYVYDQLKRALEVLLSLGLETTANIKPEYLQSCCVREMHNMKVFD